MSDPTRNRRGAVTVPATPRELQSGTRKVVPPRKSVDSLLLDYLNKPTTPGMQAVRVDVLTHGDVVPRGRSNFPTTPPNPQTLPTLAPSRDRTDLYEDERPTGRFDTPEESNPKELVRDRGVLVRLDGESSGHVTSLPRDEILVGRSTRAHVHLVDQSVSRDHARIVYQYGAYYVEDLGSQNGTLLAGRRVTRGELRDGDLVQFGQRACFRFALMDEKQERVMQRLYDSSMRDPLTGAENRRSMDQRLEAEIAFARRHQRPLAVILVDIDFFKAINDRHGHQAGDEVLRAVALMIRTQLRTEDVFARYGGEEFAVVLRDTALPEGVLVAERIRERIARTPIDVTGPGIGVTVSAGVATLQCVGAPSGSELIAAADRRLYRAKALGRNCVVSRDA
ncbi:MAG TPA: GGDEF domain-containing protein [Polyangiaceae bacterium]|nr:GGDEF domain-containing protein [Polyangiaceae bacterium]